MTDVILSLTKDGRFHDLTHESSSLYSFQGSLARSLRRARYHRSESRIRACERTWNGHDRAQSFTRTAIEVRSLKAEQCSTSRPSTRALTRLGSG